MNRSRNFLFTVILMCFLFSKPVDTFAADAGWPMFGQNPQHTGRSLALGPQTNGLKWTVSTTAYYDGMSVAADGTVYAAGQSVSAFAADGSMKWSLPIIADAGPAVGADGTVYVAGRTAIGSLSQLYALNPDGTTKWSFGIGSYGSAPVIAADGTIYIGDANAEVVAISATGQQKWRYQIGPGAQAGSSAVFSPAIGTDGTIYATALIYPAASLDGLYAINSDGTLKWHFSGPPTLTSPSIGSDGTIYATGDYDTLYAVRPDGTLKWWFNTVGGVLSCPVIGADGTIYVGSGSHRLIALNPDGSLKWNYITDSSSGASTPWDPPAIGSDGTIYVQGPSGTTGQDAVFAISPDGSLKWRSSLHNLASIEPVIGPQGTLYIASWDGRGNNYLYAFGNGGGPTLTSITPDGGAQGSILNVTAGGKDFVAGSTFLTAGPGIAAGNVNVVSPTLLTARLVIDAAAAIGIRSLTVTTPAGVSNSVSFTVGSSGSCHFTMNKTIYVAGDSIIIQSLSFANPDTKPRPIEYKFWLDIPDNPIYSYLKGGADDSVVLPAGYSSTNVFAGPQTLATVTNTFPPRGVYNLNCILVDPDTGQEIVMDSVPFLVQ